MFLTFCLKILSIILIEQIFNCILVKSFYFILNNNVVNNNCTIVYEKVKYQAISYEKKHISGFSHARTKGRYKNHDIYQHEGSETRYRFLYIIVDFYDQSFRFCQRYVFLLSFICRRFISSPLALASLNIFV